MFLIYNHSGFVFFMKIGINGFGRIGRLALRILWQREDIEITHINEIGEDSSAAYHLLEFDSVLGRWNKHITSNKDEIIVEGKRITFTSTKNYLDVPWHKSSVDLILECTGKNKTPEDLNPYFDSLGIKKVIVACPVKGIVGGEQALNIVYGINHTLYKADKHKLITAASCTTNCLAPIVKVVNENFSIKHGVITTIHDVTNTQVPVDAYKGDLRRARGCIQSLIPTTTGSAKAIAEIFPELKAKLNGHAVRVPLLNASLTDAVFELNTEVTVERVNNKFKEASETQLKGILGYEERPLVSTDYLNDSRSSIIDGLSTIVVNSNLLKVYAWYDNEWGYSCRLADLTSYVIEKEKKF